MTVGGPVISLNNGVALPAVGLGVYRASPEETAGAVTAALRTGYRMIDTAAAPLSSTTCSTGRSSTVRPNGRFFIFPPFAAPLSGTPALSLPLPARNPSARCAAPSGAP